MKKVLIVLLAGLVLPEAKVAADDRPITIGMSVPGFQPGSYFGVMMDGAEKTAAELGVKIVFADAAFDMARQERDIEKFVARGVQGILVTPIHLDGLVPAIEAAVKAGVPVATVDTMANTHQVLVHVGIDNVEGGRAAARFIIERLGNKGSVIELEGPEGHPAARERKGGFDQVINGSNVKILYSEYAFFDRKHGQGVMARLIRKYPDFDAVFASNDEMIIGAIDAMSAAGIDLSKKVTVGWDAIPDAFRYMKGGKLSATVDGLPAKQASQALRYLVDYIKNKTQPPKPVLYYTPELVTKAP